ncbi:MAG: FAD-dependent oxidoreductase [Anaerolineales bacterium]|nr:FAD-dependent oxidoreductase [Anaerolineales bacterium]
MTHFNLLVIGSGPAGAKAAEQAAQLGKTVALIEQAPRLGGNGISTGTVPSKTLRETAAFLQSLRRRAIPGLKYQIDPELNPADLMYRRQMVLSADWGLIQRNVDRYQIEVVRGQARFVDPHTLVVDGADGERTLTGDVVVIASGSTPHHPDGIPFDDPRVFDAGRIGEMARLPRRVVVLGAGVIGLELAGVFMSVGAQVTVVELGQRVLAAADDELADQLRRSMEAQGVSFWLGEPIGTVQSGPDGLRVSLRNGLGVACDTLLVAAGRRGNSAQLGLEAIGVKINEQGFIPVNGHYQTVAPGVYAAGDVIGGYSWAATSMEQGRAAVRAAFLDETPRTRVIPRCIYTLPEIASVGPTEEELKQMGEPYLVGRASVSENPRGQITGDNFGLIKVLFTPTDKKVLAVHWLGEGGAELIHIGQRVIDAGGTLDHLAEPPYAYPSLASLYEQVAYNGLEHWERWHEWHA